MPSETITSDTAQLYTSPADPVQPSKKRRIDDNDDRLVNDTLLATKKVRNNASAKSAYVLERGYSATTRLNSQYLLWKMELGWSLHPTLCAPTVDSPPTSSTSQEGDTPTATDPTRSQSPIAAGAESTSSSFRIADLATGTAIWPLDIAQSFPRAQIDAFDIDLQQCPPAQWLPPNVTLREWDIFSGLPLELENMYDVVHIRLLLLVIPDNDPRPVLRHALRMLKMGGALQWDELDPWGAYTVQVCQREGKEERGEAAGGRFQKDQELTAMSSLKWVKELHSVMQEVGFEDVRREEISCDLRLAKFFQDMQFLVMEEEAERKGTVEGKELVADAIRQGVRDSRDGMARVTPKIVCLGRKPRARGCSSF